MTAEATQLLNRKLSKWLRATLTSMPRSQVDIESDSLMRQLLSHASHKSARSVALYVSMSGEVNTAPIREKSLQAGKRVFLPRVTDKASRQLSMLELHSLQEMAHFPRGAYGISEPPLQPDRKVAPDDYLPLDLVVVPVVAFEANGRRCSHGMGGTRCKGVLRKNVVLRKRFAKDGRSSKVAV